MIFYCYCRGGKRNEKCRAAITDLVLLYNAAQEGLYGASNYDRSALFALCQGTKSGFIKFRKAHQQSIRTLVTLLYDFRVIQADATEESDTYINVKGKDSLRNGKKGIQICGQ